MSDPTDDNEGVNELAALALQWFIERGAEVFFALPLEDQLAHIQAARLTPSGYRLALKHLGSYWGPAQAAYLAGLPVGGSG